MSSSLWNWIYFLKYFLGLIDGIVQTCDRKRDERRGDDMQKRATGWTRTLGCHSEDVASVHGMHALWTEELRHSTGFVNSRINMSIKHHINWAKTFCFISRSHHSAKRAADTIQTMRTDIILKRFIFLSLTYFPRRRDPEWATTPKKAPSQNSRGGFDCLFSRVWMGFSGEVHLTWLTASC